MSSQSSKAFRAWKSRMGMTLRGVATSLGIARNTAGNYSSGVRFDKSSEGEEVEVPKSVLLACAAVEAGLSPVGQGEAPKNAKWTSRQVKTKL